MSNFCDQTIVEFIGGKGGNGSVSFRKEKFVAHGGPNGGDGGNGADIILLADNNMNTLVDYNNKKIYRGEDGGKGTGDNSSGKNGENMILKVPTGTLIVDLATNEVLCDLNKQGRKFIVARGGKGGLGNAKFKSSINQTPRFAETGEDGQISKVILELRLVADIGIIGFPSSGKSTLISRISKAKPKIADYPFTTLIPNLGVVNMADFDKRIKDSFVVADIPGLIEGAHKGKGLGHKFLKHVSRTEALVHLIDPTRNNIEDLEIINRELEAFDKNLSLKKQLIVISKADTINQETITGFMKKLVKSKPSLKKNIHIISSATGIGIKELIFDMYEQVKNIRKARTINLKQENILVDAQEEVIFRPHMREKKFEITFRRTKKEAKTGKTRKIFDVKGSRIEQVVRMTDIENPEGMERIYHFMNRMGIQRELVKMGAKIGDRIRIAGKTFKMRT